jgi:deoxyribodipyrimidine photo-lyase
MYERALFCFRRDLRLEDNTALAAAARSAREVIACFIFTEEQVREHRYRSANGLAFLIESLEELESALAEAGGRLYVLHGEPSLVIGNLVQSGLVDAVYVNRDYTPYSRKRDAAIARSCAERHVPFHSESDLLLLEPAAFSKPDGKPYTVFTPFFKRASDETISRPSGSSAVRWFTGKVPLPKSRPRDF